MTASEPDQHAPEVVQNSGLAPLDDQLTVPGLQVDLSDYLRQIWDRRDYLRHVPFATLRGRNMNTALGNVWQLLNPLISLAIYFLVFGLLLDTRGGVEDFMPFLTIGIFVYGFTQRSVTTAARAITGNKGLIRSLIFPRAILPLTSVAVEFISFLPGLSLAIIISLLWGNFPTMLWLGLPLVLLLQILLNTGLGLIAARLNDSYRDFQQILPFLFRMGFYGSGILFSLESFVSDSTRRYFLLNPLYDLVEVYRWFLLGNSVRWGELMAAIAWILIVPAGLIFFRRAEPTYGG